MKNFNLLLVASLLLLVFGCRKNVDIATTTKQGKNGLKCEIDAGYYKDKLAYVLITYYGADGICRGILSIEHRLFPLHIERTYTRLKLPSGRIIDLPSDKTQIFDYKDGVLTESPLCIDKKTFEEFFFENGREDYSLKGLEEFLKTRKTPTK